jgi:hypothetical protein
MFKKAKTNLVHWIAIFSIAMASLAPAISQAVAEQGKGFAVEICTTMGTKMVSMSDSGDTKQDVGNKSCPYCLAHTAYALPINTTLNFSEPKTLSLYPQLYYQSPKPLIAWITPPNQAPPQLA